MESSNIELRKQAITYLIRFYELFCAPDDLSDDAELRPSAIRRADLIDWFDGKTTKKAA